MTQVISLTEDNPGLLGSRAIVHRNEHESVYQRMEVVQAAVARKLSCATAKLAMAELLRNSPDKEMR